MHTHTQSHEQWKHQDSVKVGMLSWLIGLVPRVCVRACVRVCPDVQNFKSSYESVYMNAFMRTEIIKATLTLDACVFKLYVKNDV